MPPLGPLEDVVDARFTCLSPNRRSAGVDRVLATPSPRDQPPRLDTAVWLRFTSIAFLPLARFRGPVTDGVELVRSIRRSVGMQIMVSIVRETTVRFHRDVSFQLAVKYTIASWKLTPLFSRTVLTDFRLAKSRRLPRVETAGRCRLRRELRTEVRRTRARRARSADRRRQADAGLTANVPLPGIVPDGRTAPLPADLPCCPDAGRADDADASLAGESAPETSKHWRMPPVTLSREVFFPVA